MKIFHFVESTPERNAFDLRLTVNALHWHALSMMIAGMIFMYAMISHSEVPPLIVGSWGFYIGAGTAARIYYYYRARRKEYRLWNYHLFARGMWAIAVGASVFWALFIYLTYPQTSFEGRIYILLAIILANYSCVMVTYAALPAYLLYAAVVWGTLLAVDHPLEYIDLKAMAAVTVGSTIALVLSARKLIDSLYLVQQEYRNKIAALDKRMRDDHLFFMAANHDLTQPLTTIQYAWHDLNEKLKGNESTKESLGIIRNANRTLTMLIKEMMFFEKVTAGLQEIKRVPTSLQMIFDRVIDGNKDLAKNRGVFLYSRETELEVFTEPWVIERILRNLVENALRYTDEGRVMVAARRRAHGISIEVWDTGRGIKSAEKDKIFGLFFRSSEAQNQPGYGLGLSIVQNLAHTIGGHIAVKSVHGRGSVFRLMLPPDAVVKGEHDTSRLWLPATALPAIHDAKTDPTTGIVVGMHIGIIEDDTDLRKMLAGELRKRGAEVLEAPNSAEMVKHLIRTKLPVDVMLTDWDLDSERGDGAYYRCKKVEGFDAAWVVMSGNILAKEERTLKESGVPVIHKPFEEIGVLLDALSRVSRITQNIEAIGRS